MSIFSQRYTALYNEDTILPFNAGGLTQPGTMDHNCQDALAAAAGRNYIAAIVSDGKGGVTDEVSYNSSSFNEIGAQAVSAILLNGIRENISTAKSIDDLLLKADQYLTFRLRTILRTFLPHDWTTRDKQYYAFNMLSATIVGTVITPENWCIFHYGDGICGFNGVIQNLEEFSGRYYSSEFLRSRSYKNGHCLTVYAQGRTQTLQNAVIGSDGMIDLLKSKDRELLDFLNLAEGLQYERGISTSMAFSREFRMRVSQPFRKRHEITGDDDKAAAGHDDRTVFVVRRVG